MINPTPPVSSRRGAPMGRPGGHIDPDSPRYHLRRIRLNSGGYDSGGAYWGLGASLYWVADQEGEGDFFRARNRDDAKAYVRSELASPEAKFYR